MDMQEIIHELTGCGTIISGIFLLPDGRMCSEWYVPVKAFQYPPFCRKLAYEIVKHFWDMDVQVVIASRVGAMQGSSVLHHSLILLRRKRLSMYDRFQCSKGK